ncbi:MAG TPA: glutamate--tRNA ligase family protein [Candidatus Saccharimonadales bacterium]|jgi:glutamyl-tRNA synthetase
MTKIVTRFAPSPTGFMHVGGVRTALFAWLLARQQNGTFILRIEDTDKNREVAGSIDHIVHTLHELGIDYDFGPNKPGETGPYLQSERLEIYHRWAQKLIDSGRAYADPYSAAEVQAFREAAQAKKQAFLYRHHRPESLLKWDGTTPLRFKSDPKPYEWTDEIMGNMSFGPEVVDDFILIKSDGYPTYNFAHIVDDAEMGITHIIRGQEFISSMPNYLNLYEALDIHASVAEPTDNSFSDGSAFPAERGKANRPLAPSESPEKYVVSRDGQRQHDVHVRPTFATVPHIMNDVGNKKLGKRDGAKDVLDYIKDGYLPKTLVSFIATLGWNDGTEQEVFTHDELIAKFSLDHVQRSGARFDEKRLVWMNGQFIRKLSIDELYDRVTDFWPDSAASCDEAYQRQVLAIAHERLKTLTDLPALTDYFFREPTIDMTLIDSNRQLKKFDHSELALLLQTAHTSLLATSWTSESIQAALNESLVITAQKPGVLFSLIRIAVTWAPFSPELDRTLELLGRDRSLARLQTAIDALG